MGARIALLLGVLVVSGCPEEFEPPEEDPKKESGKETKSNVVKVETAVPYGKHVACEDMLDLAEFAEATGLDLGQMRDRGKSLSSATSVCAFMRAGEPPKDDAQLKKFQKNAKLGVLPGDEYCMVRTYCSEATNQEDFEEKCEKGGDQLNVSLSVPACVHRSQRATEWAYTYKVIDPDTKCRFEVLGGPSVTDENLVQLCAKASIDLISKEDLTEVRDKPASGVVNLSPEEGEGEEDPEAAAKPADE